MSQLPTNVAVEEEDEEEQLRIPPFGAVSDLMMDALARSRRRQRTQMTDVMMDAKAKLVKDIQASAEVIKDQLEQELPEGEDRVVEPGAMTRIHDLILQTKRLSPIGQLDPIIGGGRPAITAKSFLRMGIQLQAIPLSMMEGTALNMRKALEKVTGRFIPVGSFEERILRTRDELTKLTQSDAWLAPEVQDRIFAWDDGDWWAERAGEQLAILLLTMGAGIGAGEIAGAAVSRVALISTIRVGAAASTTMMIEGGFALAEFEEGLMARGFTRSEARAIAQNGASAVGFVNGLLDIAPLSEFLNKGVGRSVIMRAFIGAVKEFGTEIAQESVQIFAERRLKIEVRGTALERLKAAGSVGMFAGGGVNTLSTLLAQPLTPEQQRSKDRTELLRSDVRIIEAPKPVADVKVDTAEDVQATRQEIILQGEPRSEEQQEMLEATELQSPRTLKQEITDFTVEELTQVRESFEDIIDSGLNPFTGSVMTTAEQAEMLLILNDITEVRDVVEAMPVVEEAAQVQTEEVPDGRTQQQPETAPAPEAQPVPAQARQEAEETEAEEVEQAAKEEDEDAPEPSEDLTEEAGLVEQQGPLTQAQRVRKLARAAFDRVAAIAPGPVLKDTGARIGQLGQQISDMLFEGNARRAGRLEPELAIAKAQAMQNISDLERLHGDQAGLFDRARRWVRARGNSAEAAVERLVNAVRSHGIEDFDARIVEVDQESTKGVIQREVMEIGLAITYWESDTNVDVEGFHDKYGTGRRILININATTDEVLKTIVSHEMVHVLQMSSQTAFERFYQRISVVDPEGLRTTGKRYWIGLTANQITVEAEFDTWFATAEGRSESAALYVQERATNTGFYEKVLGTDRNLVAAFRDIIRRILSALRLASAESTILFEMDQLATAAHEAFQKAPEAPVQTVEAGVPVAAVPEGRPSFALPLEQQQQIVEQVNFALRPRGKKGETLRQVEAVTGIRKDTMSEKDMKQLRKVLRQQKKAADIGFRGGVTNAQSKMVNVLEGVFGKMGLDVTQRMIVRMQKARAARSPEQVAREGIRLMEGKIGLIRQQLREDIRAKRVFVASIKRQVQDAVTKSLTGPVGVKMQGRFLGDVRRAESPAGLLRALRRIDRAIGQVRHREAVADLRKVQRKLKKFRPMTGEIRANSALALTKARPHAVTDKGRVQTFKTRQEYDEATEEVRSAVDEIEALMADRRAELAKTNADKERTVQGHVAQTVNNMLGTPSATTPGVRIGGIKQLKGRSKQLQDLQSGIVKGLKLWHYDAANLSRHLEGMWDGDGVITALLDKNPKIAEEAYLSGRRDETDRLDKMILESDVGFINLSDAQAKMSGSLGEANQEFINVIIGGEQVTLSSDVVAELVAIDDRTVLGVVENGFTPEGAREREALRPTLAELQVIRQQWGPRFGGLVQGMKANIEILKPQSFEVAKELTGNEPEAEPTGYWMTHRNLRAAPDFGKAEDLKAFNQSAGRRYAENAGFFKKRKGGNSPFIMRGLISNYLEHVDHSLKIIHLAKSTRDAASVILNPEVVQAINVTHGKAANEYLQGHLVEISRLNEDTDGGPNSTLRATNSNLAGSWILTNIGTFIRQLGGISKIGAQMTLEGDFKWFLVGIKNLRPGTYKEMKDNSGVMWDRYEGDSAARYSSFRGQGLSGVDFAGFGQSLGGFLRAARQLDGRSSRRSWTAMMRSIKFLDWFDSVSARLAWEGYKAKASTQNPGWSEQQVMKQTALDTGNVVRNSQNTSSPLDSAGLAMRLRNNPMRVFLLFTTDPNKSLNQLVRGFHQGPKQAFIASTGVLGNILWSSFVVSQTLQLGGDLAAAAIAAALGRDIDEKEREKQRQRTFERSWLRMAEEVFGLVFFGDEIVAAWEATFSPFKRADIMRSPVGEVIADVAGGVGEVARTVTNLVDEGKITEGEMTEFWKDTFSATVTLASAAAALVGNPFLTPYYRAVPIWRQVFGEAEEETSKLKPTKPELK